MNKIPRTYKGVHFDLNGTMIDDLDCHLYAWTDSLNGALKAAPSYEKVKSQVYGKDDELLVLTTLHGPEAFDEYSNIIRFIPGYNGL